MKTPAERKAENDKKIASLDITVNTHLPTVEGEDEVTLKSLDDICGRAVAALLVIQLALDCSRGGYDESIEIISGALERYGVKGYLNAAEKQVFDNNYPEQALPAVVWEYECYWSLVWALGLIGDDELEAVAEICNCEKAINLVVSCEDMAAFREKCTLRSKSEILDKLDFFYRLHWACVENRVNSGGASIGYMNEEVVMERRRGLEWLVSEEADWFDISLDT
ncbi:DUF4272 domain-containing protein [Ruminococcus sp.]|uniref:DUF4272 domain-containing protein n=1 Tax=Ruminococcus sp. TaxID=41978 RepID=UPI0025F72C7A|nr:DUF4272 domain-containing protein [Ruminococcus sp.]MBQ8965835.1 DUF4272 domain-containing protein [Ruminococcus sp.]